MAELPTKQVQGPSRVYLLTNPRTVSNLLVRILNLSQHSQLYPAPDHGGYFFREAEDVRTRFENWHKHGDDLSTSEREEMSRTYQKCADTLQEHLKAATTLGKHVLIKEHISFMLDPNAAAELLDPGRADPNKSWTVAMTDSIVQQSHSSSNPTLLPDDFLLTWKAVFLIRTPILTVPSLFRAYRDLETIDSSLCEEAEMRVKTTYHFMQQLFDWLSSQQKRSDAKTSNVPIVLDAEDVINDREVMHRLGHEIGLDPSKFVFSWKDNAGPGEDRISARMRSTIDASSSVLTEKSPQNLNIESEVIKWRDEFGEQHATRIERWVRETLPAYEYLRAQRLRANVNQPTDPGSGTQTSATGMTLQ